MVIVVAYRMALDHPGHVDGLAVLDIVATGTAWDRADARFALGYWPWALLAQPEPLPERIAVLGVEPARIARRSAAHSRRSSWHPLKAWRG
jgi:pimeloyl-ACP methyl ester carboxylesterase